MKTQQHHDPAELTFREHTHERWDERLDVDQPISVEQAWKDALIVTNPVSWASEVRLYEPYKVLLAATWKESDTVLSVDYDRLDTDALVKCDNCELLTDPWHETDVCHWCGETLSGERADGRLTITRRDR